MWHSLLFPVAMLASPLDELISTYCTVPLTRMSRKSLQDICPHAASRRELSNVLQSTNNAISLHLRTSCLVHMQTFLIVHVSPLRAGSFSMQQTYLPDIGYIMARSKRQKRDTRTSVSRPHSHIGFASTQEQCPIDPEIPLTIPP